MYVYTNMYMHAVTTDEKEAMDLKEMIRDGYGGGFGWWKGKGET